MWSQHQVSQTGTNSAVVKADFNSQRSSIKKADNPINHKTYKDFNKSF